MSQSQQTQQRRHRATEGLTLTFDEMGVKKLPTIKSLQVEFADLLTAKKETYAELKKVRDEVRDLTVHKANYVSVKPIDDLQ